MKYGPSKGPRLPQQVELCKIRHRVAINEYWVPTGALTGVKNVISKRKKSVLVVMSTIRYNCSGRILTKIYNQKAGLFLSCIHTNCICVFRWLVRIVNDGKLSHLAVKVNH